MNNSSPEQFEIKANRRPGKRKPFYHDNQKTYVEVEVDPDTGDVRVINFWPTTKEGTTLYSMLIEVGYDLTAQLSSWPDPMDALAVLKTRCLRRADGSPVTLRGKVIDALYSDPYLDQ
tara:strand:- start:4649 stop:5002 length:354 start_codon:yes stop_codon:yes gene_type:complete